MFQRWSRPNGYRDVLAVSLPLVISMASTTVMLFTDRMFLANYSLDAIAAATPAGVTNFLFMSFFMGVGTYVNVFIAQYVGAGSPERAGAALWQGIYWCLLSGLCLAALFFIAPPLFGAVGHPDKVVGLEVTYFRILALGAGLGVLGPTLGCFYSGRGLTRPVMVVNLLGAALNIPLDYALINGVWFFPRLGIAGAALATVVAWAVVIALFAGLIFTQENDRAFAVRRSWRFDRNLFRRLMRFGLPNGVQFFLDMFAFTFFIIMIGRLGRDELAASNIVFAIDMLAFLPMIGFSIGLSTLVGQAIGRRRPEDGVQATISTLHITLLYMTLVALSFVLIPGVLLDLFRTHGLSPSQFRPISDTGVILLRFAAIYTVLDAAAVVFSGAIKGAGDTRFVMWTMLITSLSVMVIPVLVGIEYFGLKLYGAWVFITLYVGLLGLVFWLRFRGGKWQRMRVI
ncbi:MAG: MATE family efflux transporter [Proteobacteria bacterium]|nr:MATE family efflux transporter [Pseudomonadota bacterium]